jgi:hypothetical protein
MMKLERDSLRVDVPVGFLLPEQQEIVVSVDRAAEGPLAIRLRLIPAEVAALGMTECKAVQTSPVHVSRLLRAARTHNDDYPTHDVGGGD